MICKKEIICREPELNKEDAILCCFSCHKSHKCHAVCKEKECIEDIVKTGNLRKSEIKK